MSFNLEIVISIKSFLKESNINEIDNIDKLLEVPKNRKLGDIAFPCFSLAKLLKKSPVQISKEVSEYINNNLKQYPEIETISDAGPYVNFFRNKSNHFSSVLNDIFTKKVFEDLKNQNENKKIVVEYSQPNTHKEFHVGHCRCACLGDFINRILSFVGNNVIPVNYIGDEGTHVAKCLWYYLKFHKGQVPLKNKGEFLGTIYTKANTLLSVDTYSKMKYFGVAVLKIIKKEQLKNNQDLFIYNLEDINGEAFQVVCRDSSLEIGQYVPYALVGTRLKDRLITVQDFDGIISTGMITSEADIGLSDSNSIPIYKKEDFGKELVEIYRIKDALDINLEIKEHIENLNNEVGEVLLKLENQDQEILDLANETKSWSMEEFYINYNWLDSNFDHYFYESEFGNSSKKLVNDFLEKGIFEKSDGTIGSNLEKEKYGFCILIKSNNTATYAARDLALAYKKDEMYNMDKSIYVVDSGQKLHFDQVIGSLKKMGFPKANNSFHLSYGQVVGLDGKMSSRKGNVILFSELIEKLKNKINESFLNQYQNDWTQEEIDETNYKISLATIRYGMLNKDNNSNITFDIEQWCDKTGNTGSYLLYAAVRMKSILKDFKDLDYKNIDISKLDIDVEIELIQHLESFLDVILKTSETLNPIAFTTWIYDLTKKFSRFYQKASIKNATDQDQKLARLYLVSCTLIILEKSLDLLGIKSVDQM